MRTRTSLLTLLAALFALSAVPAGARGGVQEMTLRYTGTKIDAHVTVEQTTQGNALAATVKKKTIIFDDVVQPGGEFDIEGADRNGTLGPVVRIRVNGKMNAKIRTNCSLDPAPGLTFGDFEIVDATHDCGGSGDDDDGEGDDDDDDDDGEGDDDDDDDDDDGDDDDGEGDPDCDECDGQVTELTLLYHGDQERQVRVAQKYRNGEATIFDELVQPEEPFTVLGDNNRGTFGAKIFIYVDDRWHGRIHTSCSEPIGPGLVVGDFEVVEGYSRNGGRLCALEDGEGDGEDDVTGCGECDGQTTQLTLRYLGDETAHIEVTQRVKGHDEVTFDDLVEPDEPFTVYGAKSHGRMGSKIKIYVEGKLAAKIHTSCSEPIGPGLVVGDFEVVDGFSRNGGRLCALPAEDEP